MALTRRRLLAALGLAPAAVPQVRGAAVVWTARECGGCGRDVLFQSGQAMNRCGWCGTVVTRWQ